MNKLDCLYLGVKLRLEKAGERIRNFFASQDGVANVVATIVILLIVILLIAVFWEQLSTWVGDIMKTIFKDTPVPKKDDIHVPDF